MIHFDLTGFPDLPGNIVRPRIWDTEGWNRHELHSQSFVLRKKYDHEFLTEMQGLTAGYISDMKAEFSSKSAKDRQKPVSGNVKLAYAFLQPSLPEAVAIMREKCEVAVLGQAGSSQRSVSLLVLSPKDSTCSTADILYVVVNLSSWVEGYSNHDLSKLSVYVSMYNVHV